MFHPAQSKKIISSKSYHRSQGRNITFRPKSAFCCKGALNRDFRGTAIRNISVGGLVDSERPQTAAIAFSETPAVASDKPPTWHSFCSLLK